MALTRREAFKTGAAVGAASLSSLNLFMPEAWASAMGPPVKDRPLRRLSPHVFVIDAPDGFPTPDNQGMMANVIFVIGRDGVVVIDSGASLQIAQMTVRQLQAQTRLPVIGIVNTHYHGDHWLGNEGFLAAYGKDLPIYAHAEARKAIEGHTGIEWRDAMERWTEKATAGTRIVPPNRDIGHGFTLSLGDVTLRVHHYGVAHTPCDLAVEVVEDRVMCVGDILMDRRIANMEDGSYKGTLEAIEALEKNSATQIWAPAHGEASAQVVAWQRTLFQGIYEACEEAVKQGVPLDGALALAMKDPRVSSKATETRGWDRNIGKYVSIAYLEAEQAQF